MKSSRHGVWRQVRILRTRSGWTGVKLADAAGIGRSYFYQLERGDRLPSVAVLKKLAAALDVPLTMLERPLAEKERGAA